MATTRTNDTFGSTLDELSSSFVLLFRAEYPAIFAAGLAALGDPQAAADLAQETFVALLRARPAPEGPPAWLREELQVRAAHARRVIRAASARVAKREDAPASEHPARAGFDDVELALQRLQQRIVAQRRYQSPLLDLARIGPPVGSLFPDVRLPDQHGRLIDMHRARAHRRALVVFHRSALW